VGGYGTVAALVLAGWAFLKADMAWVYLAAALLFELWLLSKANAIGRHPAAAGEPPYHFTEQEARIVGRFRFYFTHTAEARGLSSVLAGIGLTALVLTPWLAYRHAFVPAALIGLNVLAVAALTRRIVPMGDSGQAWDKIREGNKAAG
jgi:hypothetical protein